MDPLVTIELPRPPRRKWQAKDLLDVEVLAAHDKCRGRYGVPRWSTTHDLQAEFPEVPPKVVLAKLKSMNKRGVLLGCSCGCRGDWEYPDAR